MDVKSGGAVPINDLCTMSKALNVTILHPEPMEGFRKVCNGEFLVAIYVVHQSHCTILY